MKGGGVVLISSYTLVEVIRHSHEVYLLIPNLFYLYMTIISISHISGMKTGLVQASEALGTVFHSPASSYYVLKIFEGLWETGVFRFISLASNASLQRALKLEEVNKYKVMMYFVPDH